ncbi:MAG: CMD domain protein [Hyphomicrobiales bacterium]|nr:CMD domain protein [Hyphomicrobiales bacterium]MBV8663382.1 CMD domain protein [Hyphomicrobiales bacterium]
MTERASDIIDELAGIAAGSPLDAVRARRPQARANAERSYRELFEPQAAEGLPLRERLAVAAFVATLHRAAPTACHYTDLLAAKTGDSALAAAVAAAAASDAHGPYGRYPSSALRSEDRDGPLWQADAQLAAALGPRLAAALAHAHMLVFHPRDASPEALEALLAAGLSATEVVTLSQIVAFLAFQIRVIEGLRLLAA